MNRHIFCSRRKKHPKPAPRYPRNFREAREFRNTAFRTKDALFWGSEIAKRCDALLQEQEAYR